MKSIETRKAFLCHLVNCLDSNKQDMLSKQYHIYIFNSLKT